MFKGRQVAQAASELPIINKLLPVNPIDLFKAEQRRKLGALISGNPKAAFEGYFQGANFTPRGISASNTDIAKARARAAYFGGGLLAANTLGIDPFGITSGITNVVSTAAHAGVGSALFMGGHRIMGSAYLAATAVNTFRRGDNLGPN